MWSPLTRTAADNRLWHSLRCADYYDVQLWLLMATMNAYLGGDESVILPAAFVSLVGFGLNAALLWYLYRMKTSSRHLTGEYGTAKMIRYRYKNARILFVGINPHFGSFDRGVPFSNNKMFWYLLSDAGILKEERNELRNDDDLKRIVSARWF